MTGEGAPEAVTPATIDIRRDEAVTLTWHDGHVSRFDLADLRANCPCAKCRGLRQMGQTVWPAPGGPATLRVESAEQVGNWGLNVGWNDGHTTGIYTWEVLRSWCACAECEAGG